MQTTVKNLMKNLDMYQGMCLETLGSRKPFRILFHDTTKIRLRLENRDISVPLSILLLGIAELVSGREFNRQVCIELLGKDWGYQYIARMLLECSDVCVKKGPGPCLMRIRNSGHKPAPVRYPKSGHAAVNPYLE